MPTNRTADRPVILGVVGDSAAGKTTLTAGVAAILGPGRVACICSDDYHRFDRRERAKRGVTALHPDSNHIDILEQHLELLRRNQPILKPVYDHRDGSLAAPEYVAPAPYIIVEGLLGYHTPRLRACYDVKVYLEPDEALRVRWKLGRDTTKRGYRPEQVLAQIAEREPDTAAYIRPQQAFADLVVSFRPPPGRAEELGRNLDVSHLLRPGLPHPDLSPVLARGTGLTLERVSEAEGGPAHRLEIAGAIASAEATGLADLLWSLMPEAARLRGHAESGQALALTQLLIAYHMVKAATTKDA